MGMLRLIGHFLRGNLVRGVLRCQRVVVHNGISMNFLNLSELLTTETELNDIAAAANTGFKRIPKKGYKTPAAMGIPITL